ncbi:MAG: alpha/beta hydrolase [Cyanobacteria bacterium CRU_2_1]|nr:alpha/beta hydrolase [Cyanobacteria bacterium CRU_2_1]
MTALVNNPATQIGGDAKTFNWVWQSQTYSITYETRGDGSPILLLPAFSTVSSRSEMRGLADHLSSQFQVVALDWLGFGQSSRPALDYNSALYQQLLQDFVAATFDEPVSVIAAGHAAGYVMQLAQQHPAVWSQIILVAPTWRGPLPTMGASSQLAGIVRQLVRSPFLGQFLYQLNTTPSFLSWMYQRHVYTDVTKLTPEFIQRKHQITQQPRARFAPAAFVTGALDSAANRDEFVARFQGLSIPVMVVIGKQAPSKSKAEMEALTELPGVQVKRLPGTLGMHEEFAAEIAAAVLPFLGH